jgi:hypothetical protein
MTIINEAKAVPERFTKKAGSLLTKSIAAESRGRIASQKATDTMIADGMLWTDFISPKSEGSTSTPELHTALKSAILNGLGATAIKLQATPTKALSEAKKAIKDANNKLVGRGMAAQRDAIRLRQDDEYRASKSQAKSRAPQQNKTGDKVVDDANEHAIKAIKKETELQKWHGNNTGLITAKEIGKLRAKIIALLQPEPEPVEPSH